MDNDLTNLTENIDPNATPNPNDRLNPSKPGVAFGRKMVDQTDPREPGVAFGQKMVDQSKNHLPNAAPLRRINTNRLVTKLQLPNWDTQAIHGSFLALMGFDRATMGSNRELMGSTIESTALFWR